MVNAAKWVGEISECLYAGEDFLETLGVFGQDKLNIEYVYPGGEPVWWSKTASVMTYDFDSMTTQKIVEAVEHERATNLQGSHAAPVFLSLMHDGSRIQVAAQTTLSDRVVIEEYLNLRPKLDMSIESWGEVLNWSCMRDMYRLRQQYHVTNLALMRKEMMSIRKENGLDGKVFDLTYSVPGDRDIYFHCEDLSFRIWENWEA